MKEIRENITIYTEYFHSLRIGHDEYSVDTDIDLESNLTRNNDLSPSTLMAKQLTENADDMVEEGK